MNRKPRPWDRLLWAVKFHNAKPIGRERGLILGTSWYDHTAKGIHPHEPSRVLLFTTRASARAWCVTQKAKYADRDDCCKDWRFTPIRVREIVRPTSYGTEQPNETR